MKFSVDFSSRNKLVPLVLRLGQALVISGSGTLVVDQLIPTKQKIFPNPEVK
jgi:hypothetical protein